jgi:AraC-like DNA-binding protein
MKSGSLPIPASPISMGCNATESETALEGLNSICCQQPNAHKAIDDWCGALRMSRRNFTRIFREETNMSFVVWRQQACLFAALPRLTAGESVTSVAMALGYDNPAAFTTMFKRLLGVPPSRYFSEM